MGAEHSYWADRWRRRPCSKTLEIKRSFQVGSETLDQIGGSLVTMVVEGLQQCVQLPWKRRGAGLRGRERPERWKRGRAARLLQT